MHAHACNPTDSFHLQWTVTLSLSAKSTMLSCCKSRKKGFNIVDLMIAASWVLFAPKWPHQINSVEAEMKGRFKAEFGRGGVKFSPSGYSQWKTSHLWSHDSSLHCALTSAFTLITTQLMAQNRENRKAHYCSSGLLAGLFFFLFYTEEAAKHPTNKCSLFCCVYPYCMTQWF